ncbi:MAG: Wadjet anti-phage system protein JetD domain-containing protein [Telluria sp.]
MSKALATSWSTPGDIVAQLSRCWEDGRMVAARVMGETLFPMRIRLRQPGIEQIGADFGAVQEWIRALDNASSAVKGYGYELAWRDINHRQTGRQRLPEAAVIPTEADALRLAGRQADMRRFEQLSAMTLDQFPQLSGWLARRGLAVLEHAAAWPRVLAILAWFCAHPRPRLYLRQLDVAGVDSKFIETRKALLAELLDQVLPAEAVDRAAIGARQFEARYGLLPKPGTVRFRMLDPRHYLAGFSDISVPVSQFARTRLDVARVFITENEVNGLAFPDKQDSMVVFGGGYGVDRLAEVDWLRGKEVFYWGDIDTHGFAILDRLRASLPDARSLMMDEATLLEHRLMWGSEDHDKRFAGTLARLDEYELALFHALRNDAHGSRIRLEQERIAYGWVSKAVANA